MAIKRRSVVDILADVAHQLSSTQGWKKRVEECLRMVRPALPDGVMALGLDARGWNNFCCPEPKDREDLETTLLRHYSILTGAAEPTALAQVAKDRKGRKWIRDGESFMGSFVSVPVTAPDHILGVLHARIDEQSVHGAERLSVLRAVAAQIGSYALSVKAEIEERTNTEEDALNKAPRKSEERSLWEAEVASTREALREAYERERHISDVLQQSLLPKVALDLPNHEIFTSYHPALKEAEVGGDFYDVFDLVDDWKALVLGDVSGKGLRAAVYTSMARYIIRAYAHEDPEPKSVLRRLNEALAEFMPDETFITVFYALLDIRRNIFVYANAGHEPPVVYSSSGGMATTLDVTGPAVGMAPRASYSQRTLAVFPGNIICVYTDGISDSRIGSDFFGAKGVSETLIKCAEQDARTIAETVYQAALEFSEGQLADDAAVLLAKVKPAIAVELEIECMQDEGNAEREVGSRK